jgi:bacterioferritin
MGHLSKGRRGPCGIKYGGRAFGSPFPLGDGGVRKPERLPLSMAKDPSNSKEGPFLLDIKKIRQRARDHMEKGAVTKGNKSDLSEVLEILNQALATEIVCVLRYKRHQYMASGLNSEAIAAEFAKHASEEQGHADMIAERITQLDGEPDFSPEGLATRSHSEYVEGKTLVDMIREDLVAERIAIETYSEIIRYLGNNDPTSRRMMEKILAMEEEHAEDMKNLLQTVGGDGKLAKSRG